MSIISPGDVGVQDGHKGADVALAKGKPFGEEEEEDVGDAHELGVAKDPVTSSLVLCVSSIAERIFFHTVSPLSSRSSRVAFSLTSLLWQ